MSLSLANNWLDTDGKVYINYSLEDIMGTLNCGKTKAVALLKELDSESGIGRIEKKNIGIAKVSVFYVMNFVCKDESVEEKPLTVDNSALRVQKMNTEEMVDGIYNLILETVLSKNEEITIAGDVYSKNLVKSKFLKLNYSHVEYVIACLGKNTTKVRNSKSYLLAILFNAEMFKNTTD